MTPRKGARDAVPAPQLKRQMGLWMAVALVIGNMVGSGVFLLPASLAAAAGPVSILAWVFTGVGAMLLALVFSRLGRTFPRTGGPYAFSRRAFGDFVGFQTAWGYWIAAWAGNAAITVAMVGYLAVFWPALATNHLLAAVVGIAVIWFLTAMNSLGVRQGAQIQLVTTILKFVPLAIVAIVGLFFVDADNLTPFAPHGTWSALSAAAPLTMWAFIGLESATVAAEEVKDPERNIPRATIYGTLAATVVYLLSTVVVMGVIPAGTLASSTSPFADAAGVMFGGAWTKVVALVAIAATFGALNGWILLQGRVPLAAAQDGLFPAVFAKVHGKNQTPVVGLVISSALLSGLMLMNYTDGLVSAFTFVTLLATLTTLVPYAYSAAAQAHLLVTEPELFDRKHFARDLTVAAFAFLYSAWAIAGAGDDIVTKGFMLLLAGIPVYVGMKWMQHRAAAKHHEVLIGTPPADDPHALPPTPAAGSAAPAPATATATDPAGHAAGGTGALTA
ncbi:amino acid permease [Patulibacter sp. SYSU D01012]|uniref:APC family permease n=1 Tax=Patulibacter sp. SYSU D01012 TaxID=2817381 RepID=UPI001B30F4E3|nr:amino acid permease [Patulibacter sp. SYSU D01012]